MNAIARYTRVTSSASVIGLSLAILALAGCITTNCAGCGKDTPCAEGPGVCGSVEITQDMITAGTNSGCNLGTFKCSSPGATCDPLKKCKTLGAPACYCACRPQ